MLGAGISLTRLGRMASTATPQEDEAPASVFSPADLSPLAWWNISDTSTLFQNSEATVPLSATATPVGAILDQSGNGHHLHQPSENARPLWHQSSGACWLENDQVDDDGFHLKTEVNVSCVVAAYQFRDGLASAFTSGRDAFFADANDGYAGNSVVGQPQAAKLATTAISEGFVVSVSESAYGTTILPLP